MSKVRVQSFGVTIDGFGAGPRQDLQNQLGVGGFEIMDCFMPTRAWRSMQGMEGMKPLLLGDGERLFQGIDLRAGGYKVAKSVQGERALHVVIAKAVVSE